MPFRPLAWLLVPLCIGWASPALANAKATEIVGHAIDGFVRPGYRKFHQATSALSAREAALCAAPSQAALDAARRAFGDAVTAWSTIEIIRFGPVTEQHRLERVLFWPDRKGTGLKQVQAALAAQDASATDPQSLAGKSVAMQGLGALEFILYGTGAEALAGAGDAYRCAYGEAVAENLDAIAGELQAAWDAPGGFAAVWSKPAPDNPRYRDGTEAVTQLMDVLVQGLELVRDVRLGGFLGKAPGDDRPKQALYWRSGHTVDAIAANLAGLENLFAASGLGKAASSEMAFLENSAKFEFGNAATASAAANAPVAELLADPSRRAKLAYVGIVTSSLSEILGTQLSGDLGLTSGFSSLDGD